MRRRKLREEKLGLAEHVGGVCGGALRDDAAAAACMDAA